MKYLIWVSSIVEENIGSCLDFICRILTACVIILVCKLLLTWFILCFGEPNFPSLWFMVLPCAWGVWIFIKYGILPFWQYVVGVHKDYKSHK